MNNLIELIVKKFCLVKKRINFCNCSNLCFCSEKRGFVAAVSGGPDSMGLALLLRDYCRTIDEPCRAVVLDHDLRDNSSSEANSVVTELANMGIHAEVIRWNHESITSAVQESAREARYRIISEYANKNKLRAIFTAHHLEDQWETYLMRAMNHSELRGLGGMKEIFLNKFNEFILRPFLRARKDSLRLTEKYVIDPSNTNTKFQRVGIRKMISINNPDWDLIRRQLDTISEINNLILNKTRDALLSCCIFDQDWSVALLSIDVPEGLLFHVLRAVIETIGGSIVSVESIVPVLEHDSYAVGRAFLDKIDNYILVRPDYRRKLRIDIAGNAVTINNSHCISLCEQCNANDVICYHKQCLDIFIQNLGKLWHQRGFYGTNKAMKLVLDTFGRSGVFCYNSRSCSSGNCFANSRCVTNLVISRIIGDLL